ncbi:MAG: sugar ABC transporter substrate-binding protein, partial [Nakamurella sp.]
MTQLRAAGAELISCDPGADPTLAVDCARRLATQQVDGWITVQPGNLGAALCGVGPQGVPLIAIAASINCQTSEVGADDERAGFLAG